MSAQPFEARTAQQRQCAQMRSLINRMGGNLSRKALLAIACGSVEGIMRGVDDLYGGTEASRIACRLADSVTADRLENEDPLFAMDWLDRDPADTEASATGEPGLLRRMAASFLVSLSTVAGVLGALELWKWAVS